MSFFGFFELEVVVGESETEEVMNDGGADEVLEALTFVGSVGTAYI
jgi:hypothetical protein